MTLVLLALAGGVGSAARYLAETAITRHTGGRRPWGLLAVNASGSFALGLLLSLDLGEMWTLVLGAGFLGGYTTFSAASLVAARSSLRRDDLGAVTHGLGMLVVCVAAAALGHVAVP